MSLGQVAPDSPFRRRPDCEVGREWDNIGAAVRSVRLIAAP
jgi:hypothetical protein